MSGAVAPYFAPPLCMTGVTALRHITGLASYVWVDVGKGTATAKGQSIPLRQKKDQQSFLPPVDDLPQFYHNRKANFASYRDMVLEHSLGKSARKLLARWDLLSPSSPNGTRRDTCVWRHI